MLNTAQATGELTGPRSLENAKEWMRDRLAKRIHPLGLTDPQATLETIEALTGLDGERWARAWIATGNRFMAIADGHVTGGDMAAARDAYYQAYGFYFLGRFPCPNHPAKEESYRLELDAYAKFGALAEPPIVPVGLPFEAPDALSGQIRFYLRKPAGVEKPPVLIMWGGVDAWKEEMTELSNALVAQGIATIALDNVGTGESPLKARQNGEIQFLPVIEWAMKSEDLDGSRIGLIGRSFGGHWATKLAHLIPENLRCAVNWGGGVHYMFQPEWVEASRYPDSYLMELVETRSRMLGAKNDAEYVEGFRVLSLLDQDFLSRPSAPLLLVNGKEDKQCPIADIHLLLDHGSPKSVRLFPGGHMGFGPHTVPTIVSWVRNHLT
ncbi:pimeloyl-ACP methyl ester carboxylesterase [Neorhizobium galegae]|uniref:alpha/beta hydrolase family protein n=1 Tax=Neorhizobium galegae TaxID=399 RepID=UPI002780B339|nr:alpha/beta hydrolase [Neorhizobium galegae]MDQ0137824.1 pimeloyl-ACP methyl ester carboxylesterase [Neorhizobium galegae]